LREAKKHTKHTALVKPVGGEYHNNEWALLGAPCGIINQFAAELAARLSEEMKVGYIDASHQDVKPEHPFSIYYQDMQSYAHVDSHTAFAQKQNRKHFASLDLLLINGNHFVGDKQIVFINDKKKESLSRKLDRLTDIRIVIVENDEQDIHDFVKPLISEHVEVFKISELQNVIDTIIADSSQYIPALNGLVLAGGKSVRMGEDKGIIDYHGKPQREYEADLLSPFCENVFISLNQNQTSDGIHNYPTIIDTFTGLGPYGAILSAFREHPNQGWLTVACDLPLLNEESLRLLVGKRNPSKVATCFHNPETRFPEPLITIWEPRAYPVLLEFLSQGYSCPRKVLINTDIEEIMVDKVDFMENVNDPQTLDRVRKRIGK
jgi:molybdopterin-guanine dinucleotide biosynthesis protein A